MYDRLIKVENNIKRFQAPTFPIYDITNPPQDAVEQQVGIDGPTDSLVWFKDGSWWSQSPSGTPATDLPQDAVEGQIAIGSDTTFYWFSNGSWHNAPGSPTDGNPPQDAINGQIAIGNADNFCWRVGDQWYTFGVAGIPPTVFPYSYYLSTYVGLTEHDNFVDFVNSITDDATWHTLELGLGCYLDGVAISTFGGGGVSAVAHYYGTNRLNLSMPSEGSGVDVFSTLYYLRNLKIGTSRGASDIFSDPLTSVPTVGPYSAISNPTGTNLFYDSIKNVLGITNLGVVGSDHVGFTYDFSEVPTAWATIEILAPNANLLNVANFITTGISGTYLQFFAHVTENTTDVPYTSVNYVTF